MKINKTDICKSVSREVNMPLYVVGDVFDEIFNNISKEVASGKEVQIANFGNFCLVHRKQKVGQNIKKGVPVIIPAHYVPKFKPAKAFKKAVGGE